MDRNWSNAQWDFSDRIWEDCLTQLSVTNNCSFCSSLYLPYETAGHLETTHLLLVESIGNGCLIEPQARIVPVNYGFKKWDLPFRAQLPMMEGIMIKDNVCSSSHTSEIEGGMWAHPQPGVPPEPYFPYPIPMEKSID